VTVGDGWSLVVPVSLVEEREPDNSLVLWDERRTIRITSLSMSGREDGSPISAEELAGEEDAQHRVDRDDGVILELPPQLPERIDDEVVWTVPARAIATNAVLIAFFHSRSEGDEQWARTMAMSISHSG